MAESTPPPMNQESNWNWFVGGTAGYLLDYEEDMYTFQFGANSPWVMDGWSVALYGEVGWTENHDGQNTILPFGPKRDLDLIPITFNAKFERIITGGLSAYIGGGLGTTYLDEDFRRSRGSRHVEDWVFTAQLSAGLAYHVNDNVELFGGARWIYFDEPNSRGISLGDDVLFEGGMRFHF